MNDEIKVEIQEFLAYIRFKQMEIRFFTEYVVKRGFIFSFDELSDILESVQSNEKVKITNEDGESIYGLLPKESDAVSVIKSLLDECALFPVCWETNCKKSSTPSPLKKRIGGKCFLFYFFDFGSVYIAIYADPTNDDYLLAEMFSESDFKFTKNCKIEIV
uniref:Uncharacterized protein n=1 Tax=Panagrolaimus sp. PS1159 TaxID=55785 RepID=A0AC35FRU2_9BILA